MSADAPRQDSDRGTAAVALVVALQAIAAVFFVADALGDLAADGWGAHIVIEALAAGALAAGVIAGAWQVRRMLAEASRREAALSVAQGALAELILVRFQEWRLTPAEADVAMFALKGCDVAQIADLRGSAPGTVRAQLARVYDKAGVGSRAAFASLFIEDLLGQPLTRAAPAATCPAGDAHAA